jgi:hypothetical protein
MNIIAEYLDLEPESLLQRISLRSDQTKSTMVIIYSWPTVDSYMCVCVCSRTSFLEAGIGRILHNLLNGSSIDNSN